uniref:RNase H type-1 domain-containing protein n=1 Tax=Chenopodium quinoa TaxID=63459 RepID=A0A803NCB4_CHEQI
MIFPDLEDDSGGRNLQKDNTLSKRAKTKQLGKVIERCKKELNKECFETNAGVSVVSTATGFVNLCFDYFAYNAKSQSPSDAGLHACQPWFINEVAPPSDASFYLDDKNPVLKTRGYSPYPFEVLEFYTVARASETRPGPLKFRHGSTTTGGSGRSTPTVRAEAEPELSTTGNDQAKGANNSPQKSGSLAALISSATIIGLAILIPRFVSTFSDTTITHNPLSQLWSSTSRYQGGLCNYRRGRHPPSISDKGTPTIAELELVLVEKGELEQGLKARSAKLEAAQLQLAKHLPSTQKLAEYVLVKCSQGLNHLGQKKRVFHLVSFEIVPFLVDLVDFLAAMLAIFAYGCLWPWFSKVKCYFRCPHCNISLLRRRDSFSVALWPSRYVMLPFLYLLGRAQGFLPLIYFSEALMRRAVWVALHCKNKECFETNAGVSAVTMATGFVNLCFDYVAYNAKWLFEWVVFPFIGIYPPGHDTSAGSTSATDAPNRVEEPSDSRPAPSAFHPYLRGRVRDDTFDPYYERDLVTKGVVLPHLLHLRLCAVCHERLALVVKANPPTNAPISPFFYLLPLCLHACQPWFVNEVVPPSDASFYLDEKAEGPKLCTLSSDWWSLADRFKLAECACSMHTVRAEAEPKVSTTGNEQAKGANNSPQKSGSLAALISSAAVTGLAILISGFVSTFSDTNITHSPLSQLWSSTTGYQGGLHNHRRGRHPSSISDKGSPIGLNHLGQKKRVFHLVSFEIVPFLADLVDFLATMLAIFGCRLRDSFSVALWPSRYIMLSFLYLLGRAQGFLPLIYFSEALMRRAEVNIPFIMGKASRRVWAAWHCGNKEYFETNAGVSAVSMDTGFVNLCFDYVAYNAKYSEMAKADAAAYGVRLASRWGFLDVKVECDGANVVRAIQGKQDEDAPNFLFIFVLF